MFAPFPLRKFQLRCGRSLPIQGLPGGGNQPLFSDKALIVTSKTELIARIYDEDFFVDYRIALTGWFFLLLNGPELRLYRHPLGKATFSHPVRLVIILDPY